MVSTVGKAGPRWAQQAVEDYAKRVRRWDPVEPVWVKPERFRGDIDSVRNAEADRLLAGVSGRDRLVCLDERGEALSTEGFIELVQGARLDGVTRLIFAIGGAYGHSPAVRHAAGRVVRLSSLVLNHEVARVVLYEQIYRAYATLHGVPYHH